MTETKVCSRCGKKKPLEEFSPSRTAFGKTAYCRPCRSGWCRETYEKNKEKYGLTEPLYVAPENWSVRNYGSHPDEYRKVIDESRKAMINLLMTTQGKSKKEAEQRAAQKALEELAKNKNGTPLPNGGQ